MVVVQQLVGIVVFLKKGALHRPSIPLPCLMFLMCSSVDPLASAAHIFRSDWGQTFLFLSLCALSSCICSQDAMCRDAVPDPMIWGVAEGHLGCLQL